MSRDPTREMGDGVECPWLTVPPYIALAGRRGGHGGGGGHTRGSVVSCGNAFVLGQWTEGTIEPKGQEKQDGQLTALAKI